MRMGATRGALTTMATRASSALDGRAASIGRRRLSVKPAGRPTPLADQRRPPSLLSAPRRSGGRELRGVASCAPTSTQLARCTAPEHTTGCQEAPASASFSQPAVRWSLVHARAVVSIAEAIVNRRDAQKVLRKALRPQWCGPESLRSPMEPGWVGNPGASGGHPVTNAERKAIADAVLGVEVNRLRLAFVASARVCAARADALEAAGGLEDGFGGGVLAALLRRGGIPIEGAVAGLKACEKRGGDGGEDDTTPLDHGDAVTAAEALLALHWTPPRGDDGGAGHEGGAEPPRQQMAPGKLAVLLGEDAADGDWPLWPADPAARIAAQHSLPGWLAARLVAQFGPRGASSLAAALLTRAPLTVRRNRRRCASPAALVAALAAEDVEAVPLSNANPRAPRAGAEDAMVFTGGRPRVGIFGLSTYEAGMFEVQDAGSQCIAAAVADAVLAMAAAAETESDDATVDKPSRCVSVDAVNTCHDEREARGGRANQRVWRVLDMCAGNGGKALAVASKLSRLDGDAIPFRVDCFDVDERRLRHLRAGAARAGVANNVRAVTAEHLRAVADAMRLPRADDGDEKEGEEEGEQLYPYDAVLVDVPCSSTGALRRFPSLRWEMDETATVPAAENEEVREALDDADWSAPVVVDADWSGNVTASTWQTTQRRILARAAQLVRPGGGALVYATCSILREENGDNVRWFERRWSRRREEGADGAEGEGTDAAAAMAFAPLPFPAGWPEAAYSGAVGERDDTRDERDDLDERREGGARETTTGAAEMPSHEVTLLPHVHGTDGFFIARWARGETRGTRRKRASSEVPSEPDRCDEVVHE